MSSSKKASYKPNGVQGNVEEDAELTQCGIFGWRPKILQTFASPFYFMLVMSLVGIFQCKCVVTLKPLFLKSFNLSKKKL